MQVKHKNAEVTPLSRNIFLFTFHFFVFLFTLVHSAQQLEGQGITTVSGVVLDERTQSPLPYVTIQTGSGKAGVRTDIDGHFLLEVADSISSIKISYVGFETQVLEVRPFQPNEMQILLFEANSKLKEITIKPQKYKKNNPAVDLVEQVFLHKDKNRKESLDYFQFEKYERLRFDWNGITDDYRKKWYLKKFRFVFDYCDTNKVNQKVALPFYFRERLLESYYRKKPADKKEKLLAERQSAFDDGYDVDGDGISSYLSQMYNEVDIYEPTITLLDKQFIGPLSGLATDFYRFYIIDTVLINNQKFADVFFAPKNKNDLAFMGNMLVALDSTYAVRRVEMGISKDINLNWVADLRIEQEFEFFGQAENRRLMLTHDMVLIDMKILKNRGGRSVLVTKHNSYQNYLLNQPQPDSLFAGKQQMMNDTGEVKKRPDTFWENRRHLTLNETERNVDAMIDSVKQTPTFRFMTHVFRLGTTGFDRIGKIEIGELINVYSFNDVEGNRLQLSFRTQDKYFQKFRATAYGAYGTRDRAWKFGANTTIALNGARPGRFPANQIKLAYTQDLFFPGIGSKAGQSIINSVQRGGTNLLLLNKIIRADYAREFRSGFSFSLNGQRREVREPILIDSTGQEPESVSSSVATELGTWLRYAPNERFYQTRENRVSINNRWPIFYAQFRTSVKDLFGGDYQYQRGSVRIDKIFYVAPFGKSRWSGELGQVFGQVSYPFLEIHRANQTYFYDDFSYTLMNYLEFVSDRYATLSINHDFEGILLNRIPLIKKLKWRESVTFKGLYGSLSQKNRPTTENGLVPFPADPNGVPLTRALGKMPYIEAGVGINNIFGFLRVDYVWRLTYRENPSQTYGGVRFSTGVSF